MRQTAEPQAHEAKAEGAKRRSRQTGHSRGLSTTSLNRRPDDGEDSETLSSMSADRNSQCV